ncbi:hypothetical protein [Stackebrandtia soli]|uniref:hypothetical protein n=1 Tax=Stackebrandtia soli TaxID=1892856 RepID=UPI0039E7E01B
MPRSRRSIAHPPVLSTADHAVAEAEFLGQATAVAEVIARQPFERPARIPDSPAALWMSEGKKRFQVDCVDEVPDALRDWVAPIVVVTTIA